MTFAHVHGVSPIWHLVSKRWIITQFKDNITAVTIKGDHNWTMISPIHQVDPGDAPTLLLHGDSDKLVPLQQSQILLKKLNSAKIASQLIIKEGAGHGWVSDDDELKIITDWFMLHLSEKPKAASPQ